MIFPNYNPQSYTKICRSIFVEPGNFFLQKFQHQVQCLLLIRLKVKHFSIILQLWIYFLTASYQTMTCCYCAFKHNSNKSSSATNCKKKLPFSSLSTLCGTGEDIFIPLSLLNWILSAKFL